MNILDIIFCVILGYFLLRGFINGLVREAASIVGLVVGFYAANHYGDVLVPQLADFMGNGGHADTASYLLVFVGTMFASWIALRMLSGLLRLQLLATADHAMGGLLGFLKGGLICAVTVLAMATFIPDSEYLVESRLSPHIAKVAAHMAGYLPDEMRQTLEDSQKKLSDIHFRMPDKILSF
ncbi:Colicin V production protein [Alkalidesulfovibrio alkalitolerans DSM 16529]|uniref:Colicin V production protein n=1 Tax=Alkalidesulfovibrio alkalitolerans DSM 16529 TaxID=1121439 RepID=S7UT56_9BACT|nr:CvpA family protein [Alkalidesulfovibrio alkalitolerans]EPR35503.1 Colicin V production protein [Alkalidesulfovibrio alkalitolerans DSM 16529]